MKELIEKYYKKMISAGLASDPLVCGLDDELFWNREDESIPVLKNVQQGLNINSLICSEPAEPYRTIIEYLANRYPETITPGDCETRTFLHDLPVTDAFTSDAILSCLRKRKSVIVNGNDQVRIVTFGTVSPEQAFVTFSSVCFSSFVLFFSEYLADLRQESATIKQHETYNRVLPLIDIPGDKTPPLMKGPFTNESQVINAIIEAGQRTVEYDLVDSYFGNISYRLNDTVYISQTASSLDDLAGCIDPCPLDGSSCAGVTASSELTAHNEIFLRSEIRSILHGHPKFTVILSMDCKIQDCPQRDKCHIKCSQERFIEDIPIVPGEVGTGPTGLCNTLPPAIKGNRGAIVWGHGLFTTGTCDFNEAFMHMMDIEDMCRREYLAHVKKITK